MPAARLSVLLLTGGIAIRWGRWRRRGHFCAREDAVMIGVEVVEQCERGDGEFAMVDHAVIVRILEARHPARRRHGLHRGAAPRGRALFAAIAARAFAGRWAALTSAKASASAAKAASAASATEAAALITRSTARPSAAPALPLSRRRRGGVAAVGCGPHQRPYRDKAVAILVTRSKITIEPCGHFLARDPAVAIIVGGENATGGGRRGWPVIAGVVGCVCGLCRCEKQEREDHRLQGGSS